MSALTQFMPRHAHHQAVLATSLRLIGWCAVTLLTALGCMALLAFILGGFTIAGTMFQLDNLASRYVAAEAARTAQFDQILLCTLGLALLWSAYARRASLSAILTKRSRVHV